MYTFFSFQQISGLLFSCKGNEKGLKIIHFLQRKQTYPAKFTTIYQ